MQCGFCHVDDKCSSTITLKFVSAKYGSCMFITTWFNFFHFQSTNADISGTCLKVNVFGHVTIYITHMQMLI